MAGPLDHQIGIGVESTFGTAVTPTRFVEADFANVTHNFDPMVVQGTGMQVGDGGIARADRSVSVVGQGSGSLAFDLQTKGLGLWFNGIFGNGASTLVAGTTYQHLFTSASTAALLPSQTLQIGVVRGDSAGTVDAFTYRGVTFTKLSLGVEAGGVTTCSIDWDALGQTTATALATASYPSGLLAPVHFGQWSATIGGSVTAPTTTALASGGTAAGNVKSFQFEWDRSMDTARWVLGGTRNQPRGAKTDPQLTLSTEYDSLTYDTAQVAHTTLPVTLTATTDQALSTGFAQVQLTFPACKITSTNRPSPSDQTPTVDYTFAIRKPASGAAISLAIRTADSAL